MLLAGLLDYGRHRVLGEIIIRGRPTCKTEPMPYEFIRVICRTDEESRRLV